MINEEKIISNILQCFIPQEYWELYDWHTIIERRKEVKDGIYCFDCHFVKLYFDDKMNPVTYAKQKVVEDTVYYDLNKHDKGAGTLTPLGKIPNIKL